MKCSSRTTAEKMASHCPMIAYRSGKKKGGAWVNRVASKKQLLPSAGLLFPCFSKTHHKVLERDGETAEKGQREVRVSLLSIGRKETDSRVGSDDGDGDVNSGD